MEVMTFQELTNKIGSSEIYSGTTVDQATQECLLEWMFNRKLSMFPDEPETNWLRRYRRNLNKFYPVYLDYLRVETVRSNMDPFITDFIEKVHNGTSTSTSSETGSKTSEGSNSGSDVTTTDNTQVRTPNLTSSGTTGNTRTDNLATSNTTGDTGTVSTTGSEDSTDNGQQRSMNIVYPEANMGSIPSTINGFPSSIDYAEGENDVFSKNEHDGTRTNQETRNLTQTSSGTQTGTVTDSGTNSVRETGTDTVDFDGSVTRTSNGSKTNEESSSLTASSSNTDNGEETEQGRRGKSIAELLPQAIEAIVTTNSIQWLVNKMSICFDNYY